MNSYMNSCHEFMCKPFLILPKSYVFFMNPYMKYMNS